MLRLRLDIQLTCQTPYVAGVLPEAGEPADDGAEADGGRAPASGPAAGGRRSGKLPGSTTGALSHNVKAGHRFLLRCTSGMYMASVSNNRR